VAPNSTALRAAVAALTLESELDLALGQRRTLLQAGSGETDDHDDDEIIALLNFDDKTGTVKSRPTTWVSKMAVVTDPELDGLVTRIHGANTTMVGARSWTTIVVRRLRFVPRAGRRRRRSMVYLLKQGTFYPFAPTGPNQRDNELECVCVLRR